MPYDLHPIAITPGVNPTTDTTAQSTSQYTFTDKVRFVDGFPQKIGGWQQLALNNGKPILGIPRTLYSYVFSGNIYYLIGTYSNLYMINGSSQFNATPVVATNTTLTNPFRTYYGTLTNPFTTTTGSVAITVTDSGHPFANGDTLQFGGSTAVGGIPAAQINTTVTIGNVTTNTYTFNVMMAATSSVTGGGTVTRASRVVGVTQTNTFRENDNVNFVSVGSAVGGIPPASIQGIRVVRSVTGSGYNIVADSFATSSVTGAGGTVQVQGKIPDGQLNPTTGSGYGLGYYGVGRYGVSKTAVKATPPTIWSFDRFGSFVVGTAGNQTGVYQWNNSTSTLPTLVPNAPAAVNYTFVSDNIQICLAIAGVGNRVGWSDQGDNTVWTATAQNQAGQQDVQGAGEFISHAQLTGYSLIFTQSGVYTFRYIGKPFVYEIKEIDKAPGLIARNARVVANGVAYWMGNNNFYMYNGASVAVIPANTSEESTIKNYVFNNLNVGQQSKCFAMYNQAYNEIEFHYPSKNSNECDSIARVNVLDKTWCPDTIDRTAGEYPRILGAYPYMASKSGTVYQNEFGNDAAGAVLPFTATGPYITTDDKTTVVLGGVYPDSINTAGPLQITLNTKRYPQQIPGTTTYTLAQGQNNIMYRKSGRYWQYTVSGSALGQFWRAGKWDELYMPGGKR